MIALLTTALSNRIKSEQNRDEHSFFRLSNPEDCKALEILLHDKPNCVVLDEIQSQLRDLIKLENPTVSLSELDYQEKISFKLNGRSFNEFGVWIYYPWKDTLVHILDEEDFVRVRTIRNAYKITPEEQAELRKKKIGVVGMSVGQSAVMALAMERIGGELRIADFDNLELSNMNRIRAGVHEIGILKGEIVRREIAEIDPFLKVVFYDKGITNETIDDFLQGNGGLDLLVEECDSSDVKIKLRKQCAKLGIPVVMDTSDRSILDVERFDLDREYPILHGLVSKELLELDEFTDEQKREVLFQCIDLSKVSEQGKFSLGEIGKTITTWPQLATDVIFGGAIVAMAARMILLNQGIKSSRTYVDVPSIISK